MNASTASLSSAPDTPRDDSPSTPNYHDWSHNKALQLPFRRISLPPVSEGGVHTPSSSKRVSIASAFSFESTTEEEPVGSPRLPIRDALHPNLPVPSRLQHERPSLAASRHRPKSSSSISSIELNPKGKLAHSARNSRGQRSRSRIAVQGPLEEVFNAKRLKVMIELFETERAYVEGLDLVYTHFLTPLIASLSETTPLLSRPDLTNLFANFVDIWNLHRSLLNDLTQFFSRTLGTMPSVAEQTSEPLSAPPTRPSSTISITTSDPQYHHVLNEFLQILVSHFPYLSMYNPFVTSFPSALSLLTAISTPPPSLLQSAFPRPAVPASGPNSGPGARAYQPAFGAWLKNKEADPVCRKLKLRDWLLTVIQRCPRYLLLIKELLGYTTVQDPAHELLLELTSLITKVTTTLNDSLAAHAQIMSLISLQKSTPNLPFPLIVPGRNLIRRTTVIKVDRGSDRRLRDLMLFNDCLVWISRGGEREDYNYWGVIGEWASAGLETGQSVFRESILFPQAPETSPSSIVAGTEDGTSPRQKRQWESRVAGIGHGGPPLARSAVRRTGRVRSRSDADVNALPVALRPSSSPSVNSRISPDPSLLIPPSSSGPYRREQDEAGGGEEKWWYRGRAELMDIEVVVSPIISTLGEERMFEVMSPQGSFEVYTASQSERDAWVQAIRSAKSARLASFQITHPNTTLTSSTSTNHIRRALQALPHDPALQLSTTTASAPAHESKKRFSNSQQSVVRRGRVDHFVPAIWVPDQKTDNCMRCKRRFGWRRRRHHCRLCGRVVCANCSEKTFYISDPLEPDHVSTPARACNACYEAVFPILPDPGAEGMTTSTSVKSSISAHGVLAAIHSPRPSATKGGGASGVSNSLSMPSLSLAVAPVPSPSVPSLLSAGAGSRLRAPSFLRRKPAASPSSSKRRDKITEANPSSQSLSSPTIPHPPTTPLRSANATTRIRRSLASLAISESSLEPNDADAETTSALETPDDASSLWLSTSQGSSQAAFPASFAHSATIKPIPKQQKQQADYSSPSSLAFPRLSSDEEQVGAMSASISSAHSAKTPIRPIAKGDDKEDLNATVHAQRGHGFDSASATMIAQFDSDPDRDMDVTPRPTTRHPARWSIGVQPVSLPMPDFSLGSQPFPLKSDGDAEVIADKGSVAPKVAPGTDITLGLGDDTLRANHSRPRPKVPHPSSQSAAGPSSSSDASAGESHLPATATATTIKDSVSRPHQPQRAYKRRTSIVPFPSHLPLALSVQNDPVTARTRAQGVGKARRFSLMLGGTIRGAGPVAQQVAAGDVREDRAATARLEPSSSGVAGGVVGRGGDESGGPVGPGLKPRMTDMHPSPGPDGGEDPVGGPLFNRPNHHLEGAAGAQAAPPPTHQHLDNDTQPPTVPSLRSSLRHGVAISKLAELLGRDSSK